MTLIALFARRQGIESIVLTSQLTPPFWLYAFAIDSILKPAGHIICSAPIKITFNSRLSIVTSGSCYPRTSDKLSLSRKKTTYFLESLYMRIAN